MRFFIRALWVMFVLSAGSARADIDSLTPEVIMSDAGLIERLDDPRMLTELAARYEHAEGVSRDYGKAILLYCRAARAGYADAQYALGWIFTNGRGVPRDDSVATQLFAMAAQQGHVQAKNMMVHGNSSATTPLPSCLLPEQQVEIAQRPDEKQKQDEPDKKVTVADKNLSEGKGAIFPRGPIANLVHQLAPRYEVDPRLALAVISVESGFNVRARSSKNAQGLMQLIPETAQRFKVKDVFDARENIKGGLAYLQWLLAFFKGNVSLVAAAYNAGEKAVEKYRGIPPYPETQDYVRKIAKLYGKSTHPYRNMLVESSSVALLEASAK